MELNQEIVAVTKSSLVEQNPSQKNDPLTLEESKQEDKPASKEYQPLYLDHFVMPQDVERYKVLLKKKQHLLLRAHIVIEDLRYSKTSFWP